MWLSARHVSGAQNTQADQASGRFNDSVEWSLSTDVFQTISAAWGPFDIDLFASIKINLTINCLVMPHGDRIQGLNSLMHFVLIGKLIIFMHCHHLV